jgi:glutamine synthetase
VQRARSAGFVCQLAQNVFHPRFITEYADMKLGEYQRSHLDVSETEGDAYLLNI